VQTKLAAIFRGQGEVQVAALCRELEISRDTYYRLRRRFAVEGLGALVPRSRRPHHSPSLISAGLEDEIVRLRKTLPLDNGAWSIRQELLRRHGVAPAESTIHRALRRRGMVTPQPQKRPKGMLRRFEFARPRDCWQIDISEWKLPDGTLVHLVDVVDDCSRQAVGCRASLVRDAAAVWSTVLEAFAESGLPGMFLSDNGRVFTARFAGREAVCDFERNLHALGIRTVNSQPYHPQTCGKVEHFHGTLKRWLRRQPPAHTLDELQTQIDAFRRYYNNDRPHRALADNGRNQPASTPVQRWAARAHGGPAATPLPTPLTAHEPLVSATGTIGVGDMVIHVGVDRAGQRLIAIRQDQHVLVFDRSTLIADRHLDPSRHYQPSGRKPGRRPRA
jgi:transposase InsO family protein